MSQAIPPLRIQKYPGLTPTGRMPGRPLSEIGPGERRRNSPSYNQVLKKPLFQHENSPLDLQPRQQSPHRFWQSRDPGSPSRQDAENREADNTPPFSTKRSSIENLKRASRVKTNSIFTREHKPESEIAAASTTTKRPDDSLNHESARNQSASNGQLPKQQGQSEAAYNGSQRLPQVQHSPSKSSMSSKSRYNRQPAFDPRTNIWSDEDDKIHERHLPPGKVLHRHAKSVTFDAAPPKIQEYEMSTPAPSSTASDSCGASQDSADDDSDGSFEYDPVADNDDSFDAALEDETKTPVVMPEDWKFMSPHETKQDEPKAQSTEDIASAAADKRPEFGRSNSITSNDEVRPLPPIPASTLSTPKPSATPVRKSSAAERVHSSPRLNSTPPLPPSISKTELQNMGGCSMPIEERLQLMMLNDDPGMKTTTVEQRERRMRRGSPLRSQEDFQESQIHDQNSLTNTISMESDQIDAADDEYELPPKISRESILKSVQTRLPELSSGGLASLPSSLPRGTAMAIDPDVPLPTIEGPGIQSEAPIIKQEPDEEEEDQDIFKIPHLYNQHVEAHSLQNAMNKLQAIKETREAQPEEDDDESHYSNDCLEAMPLPAWSTTYGPTEKDGTCTPKAIATAIDNEEVIESTPGRSTSVPQSASLLDNTQDNAESSGTTLPASNIEWMQPSGFRMTAVQSLLGIEPDFDGATMQQAQPAPPLEQIIKSNGDTEDVFQDLTPGLGRLPDFTMPSSGSTDQTPLESPTVPEPFATIRASGSKLKTRPSATPADFQAMAETRRQISAEHDLAEPRHHGHNHRPSTVAEAEEDSPSLLEAEEMSSSTLDHQDRKDSCLSLNVPISQNADLDIENEFDRLLEAKKKGYMMRQNTKVIVASSASQDSMVAPEAVPQSSRAVRSAGNSPRKSSNTKAWTTEPWNGKMRRKSVRKSTAITSRTFDAGPVPPLPGCQSNVSNLQTSVPESAEAPDDISEDDERGRLFIKVVRLKDLDLPLSKVEKSYFALTLDNGLHCVTTSWLELGQTAPIGQEFELVVLNDLEFQLTLQTKIAEPKAVEAIESSTKSSKSGKPSALSRVFASPRKRKEMELKQRQQQDENARHDRKRGVALNQAVEPHQATHWSLLHKLVGKDGSFARSYICLKDHESEAFGSVLTVDVPCFNEWATDDGSGLPSSTRSKRGMQTGGMQRRPPYKVGKLELQLLYVPKPKGAADEDMPKSMNACIRDLKEAENAGPTKWEGHLSQQGGDCPYWRRRFFTLNGSKLTAYHEATRQPRATINLAKASKLIDDKTSLINPGASNRRKSAFAEEEEGYMFVEEGFRMRFANGETIDFYADSAAEKDAWMRALAEVVGKDLGKVKRWTDLVLERRKAASSNGKANGPTSKSSQIPVASQKLGTAPGTSSSDTAADSIHAEPSTSEQNGRLGQATHPRQSDVHMGGPSSRRAVATKTRSMIF